MKRAATKNAAIVVFVESGMPVPISERLGGAGRFVLEFRHLLHNSLTRTGACEAFDIVACGAPETLAQLPDEHVVKAPFRPDPFWDSYEYGKSVACLLDPSVTSVLERYDALLRSDTDVFLTSHAVKLIDTDLATDTLFTGRGGYCNDGVAEKLDEVAQREGYVASKIVRNVGSTVFGRSASVLRWARTTEHLLRVLLTKDFAAGEGEWPGWYRGVSLLYAGEIAANFHHAGRIDRDTFHMDGLSTWRKPIPANCPHIHCWHTDDVFSKFWWYAGHYDQLPAPPDDGTGANYCFRLAMLASRPS